MQNGRFRIDSGVSTLSVLAFGRRYEHTFGPRFSIDGSNNFRRFGAHCFPDGTRLWTSHGSRTDLYR